MLFVAILCLVCHEILGLCVYNYKCIINRIIDGDTVDVDIDLGFDFWLRNQRIRLAGIDAPETRTRDLNEKARGMLSKEFVESVLVVNQTAILRTTEYNNTGKYGRIIGDFEVYNPKINSWEMLTAMMLTEGYAVPYKS